VAREVLTALGVVLRRRGDRLGLAATRRGDLDLLRPPRADRRGLVSALAALDRLPHDVGPAGRTDLARAVTALGRVVRHRGVVAILSDFPLVPGLEQALGVLGRRHEVMCIELRDRREREMPELGPLRLRDMETGRVVLVDTSDPRFQERFTAASADADAQRETLMSRAGARHLVATTEGDWVLGLARMLGRPRPRRAA
jgi:uncharacterized protein (DUF58 family)